MGLGLAGFQPCSGQCLETRREEEDDKMESTRSMQVMEMKFACVRDLAHQLGDN